jgi:acetyl-CoA carboxylase biotin carboxyl carrier protein
MDIRKIKKLIALIDKTGVSEIEIKEGDETIRISNHKYDMAKGSPTLEISHKSEPSKPSNHTSNNEKKQDGHIIKSPMVGTMYISPSPDTDPFVQIGQKVDVGDTLCIIEAMKMYNEIEADKAGIIKARLVESGSPVEYGQPLFIIE